MTDQVYDDGSEVEVRLPPEEPPKSGVWVESHVNATDLDEDEIGRGNALGELIDVDDDEDNGGVPREKA
jgi:hypothetical protein